MLLQIGSGHGLVPVPGADPWFYDRLRGWSLDPNQFGLVSVFLTLLALHLAETAGRPAASLAAVGLALPALAAGVLEPERTFIIALMVGTAFYVVLKSAAWVRDVDVGPTLRGAAVVLGVMALPLMVVAASPVLVGHHGRGRGAVGRGLRG